MTSNDSSNPNDRPWLRNPQQKVPQQKAVALPKRPFEFLDSVLTVLMVLALLAAAIAMLIGMVDSDGMSFVTGLGLLGSAITAALGRVLVFIAQKVDEIAEQSGVLGAAN